MITLWNSPQAENLLIKFCSRYLRTFETRAHRTPILRTVLVGEKICDSNGCGDTTIRG